MSTEANGAPDFKKLSGEMYKQWEKAMTAWWDQVLESPAFLGAVNQGMTGATQGRGAYQKAVTQWMEQAHLPTRDDLIRLLRVSTLLEDRLLAQEDHLLELKDRLVRAEKEALEARIAAAEAQLAVQERLDAVQAKLDALLAAVATPGAPAGVGPSEPAPSPRRARRE